ncbi:three-Cys-motif partner protein TcmP [Pseudoxanthomonas sp. LH2527]|uniref:three-Cys-motif partner protein TcmP n=1 Tax=Pseudoxanthomonas sp. LH2527 TaxID=2923249 RepID=UPI001F138C12|nr:three-Cys-motif partner protein TcmP [Pseudoxanthomonas sp. LH2527]MCH6482826.1 three-Cys-motif partner protein TcmP [Pseudoxanthomonas sp. LH2527]
MASKAEYENDPADGLPCLKVQEWAQRKHRLLTQYIEASSQARKSWPRRTYIDLYCGPGRCLNQSGGFSDGSPVAAFKASSRAPFTAMYISDFSRENVGACEARLQCLGVSPDVFVGKAEDTVHEVVKKMDRGALHLAFLDPFSLHALPFSVIDQLSAFRKIDFLIHFSVMDFVRNYEKLLLAGTIDQYIPGASLAYRKNKSLRENRRSAFGIWYQALLAKGYHSSNVEMVRDKGKNMYWLIHATGNQTALNIWNDIQARDSQRGFEF